MAEPNKHNLYAWSGTTSFVAILDSADFQGFGGSLSMTLDAWIGAVNPTASIGRASSPTRATPGGEAFAFQSHAKLTPYDNEGHGEIYRYDPAAAPGGRLICVSCDPSGAPASADALLADVENGVNVTTVVANLTDGGQTLFFDSPDRLLPEDANDATDVYEWKAEGAGVPACDRQGGCLALISSGQGESGSFLYGMSADGHDVFFRTREKLVGADLSGSPSIYDARVDGGIPDPSIQAPCQGDACQGAGGAPPGLPPAATGGPGGGNEKAPLPARCAKGRHRAKGRCVPVKHHKPRHRKHRRAGHKRGVGR